MAVLKVILTVLLILISVFITVVILMQEGKSANLGGAISGVADTYWGKNKGRSMEGMLVKLTRIAVVLFFILALVLNLGVWG